MAFAGSWLTDGFGYMLTEDSSGRADCRNDFFKHALEYLKGREILFVISLPYFYCAGLAICATLPFLEV